MSPSREQGSDRIIRRYRVEPGAKFHLGDFDAADTAGLSLDGRDGKQLLGQGIELLADLQSKLYAQCRWGVLLVFQAMDAAGKDSTIKHVMSGVNPQGVQVFSFKAPSAEELRHDFLWRTMKCLPERGRIGIFNRSYHEEVLVARVHPELLEAQRLPPELLTEKTYSHRYEDINAVERYLARNGFLILKFFLNISKAEQKARLLERLDRPSKHRKFAVEDLTERAFWNQYMTAYESMIAATSTEWAPWHVVPADNKRFTRIAVAATIIRALERLDLAYPRVDAARRRELAQLRAAF